MIHQHVRDFREGKLTFAQFRRCTETDWRKMAAHLMRRYKTPPSTSLDDVVQELVIGCWIATEQWKPGGMELAAFCVWRANNHAKKWMHRERAAKRRSDRSESRLMIPFSALGDGERGDDPSELLSPSEARQDERVDEERLRGTEVEELARAILSSQRAREAAMVQSYDQALLAALDLSEYLHEVA